MTLEDFVTKYQKVPVVEYPNKVLELVPTPMVSCRISTYQHAKYIRECLDGVLKQKTNFPFEIVIGEDQSNDGTREICIEYAEKHPDKIRLFLHDRQNNILINGKPSSRFQSRYTQFQCRGQFIAICEGDDYWIDPYKLQKQVDFLLMNPDHTLVCGGNRVIKADGTSVDKTMGKDFSFTILDYIDGKVTTHYQTLLFDPKVLDLAQYYTIKRSKDFTMFFYLLKKGKGHYMNDVFSVYRMTDGGVWAMQKLEFKYRWEYEEAKSLYEFEDNKPFIRTKYFYTILDLISVTESTNSKKELLKESLRLIRKPREFIIWLKSARRVAFTK